MKITWVALLVLGLMISCSSDQQKSTNSTETSSSKLRVAAVNYPLAFFAETIGGEQVKVIFLAPGDVDPAYWVPEEQDIVIYQESDLILLNGAGYAKWIESTSLPSSRLVNTSAMVKDQYIEIAGQVAHTHGPQGEHTHSSLAITTWLDMSMAKAQAMAVRDALIRKMPKLEKELNANFQNLTSTLDQVNEQFTEVFENYDVLYGSHPVYQYLARAYGVEIRSVHWEPGQEITLEQWYELEELMNKTKSSVMLWEGEPAESVARRLNGRGINSVVFDPCGNTPEEGDFLEVMKNNAERLKKEPTQ